mmetsp:Transcript_25545/g.73482  ORF Transcript_25545/g.73482 Transcript_25545/m.73482 type:complete len:233 (+) Transcript_25545:300-998(+)
MRNLFEGTRRALSGAGPSPARVTNPQSVLKTLVVEKLVDRRHFRYYLGRWVGHRRLRQQLLVVRIKLPWCNVGHALVLNCCLLGNRHLLRHCDEAGRCADDAPLRFARVARLARLARLRHDVDSVGLVGLGDCRRRAVAPRWLLRRGTAGLWYRPRKRRAALSRQCGAALPRQVGEWQPRHDGGLGLLLRRLSRGGEDTFGHCLLGMASARRQTWIGPSRELPQGARERGCR